MTGDRLFTEQELADMTSHEHDRLYKILKDDEKGTQLLKSYEALNSAVLGIYKNFTGTIQSYVQEKKGVRGFEEAASRFIDVGWKGWFFQVHNTGKWMQAWTEEPHRSHYKKAIMEFAAFARAHSGRGFKRVEEDDKKVSFIMDPCGSGGDFRRSGKYDPPYNWQVTKDPQPMTLGRSNFPFFCQNSVLYHYLRPIEWAGIIWPVVIPGEKDGDPCIWEFWKDPADVPEEHYKRVGKDKVLKK